MTTATASRYTAEYRNIGVCIARKNIALVAAAKG